MIEFADVEFGNFDRTNGITPQQPDSDTLSV